MCCVAYCDYFTVRKPHTRASSHKKETKCCRGTNLFQESLKQVTAVTLVVVGEEMDGLCEWMNWKTSRDHREPQCRHCSSQQGTIGGHDIGITYPGECDVCRVLSGKQRRNDETGDLVVVEL